MDEPDTALSASLTSASVQEGPGSRVVGPAALASAPVPGLEPGPGKRGIQAPLHHVNTITENAAVDTYAPFAEIYEEWSAPMTEDIPFYVGLAQEADGPVVELAVGTAAVAVPWRRRSAGRCSDRPLSRNAGQGAAG